MRRDPPTLRFLWGEITIKTSRKKHQTPVKHTNVHSLRVLEEISSKYRLFYASPVCGIVVVDVESLTWTRLVGSNSLRLGRRLLPWEILTSDLQEGFNDSDELQTWIYHWNGQMVIVRHRIMHQVASTLVRPLKSVARHIALIFANWGTWIAKEVEVEIRQAIIASHSKVQDQNGRWLGKY